MIATCTPRQARDLLASTPECQALDVREYAEYAAAHVPGTCLIPLGQVRARIGEIDKARPVLVFCKGGKRAAQAAAILDQAGCSAVTVVEGGTDAWIAAGLPVATERKAPWALERQVRLAAGLLMLLGLFIPPWPWLSAFVGAGLVFAAVSNTCGMALLLARMPWNRAPACATAGGNTGAKSCCG
jgi:rhodanese-related sulfurtransferase